MFTNYRYNWKKRNNKILRKLTVFHFPKKSKTQKYLTHISVCLPKFNIKKLEPRELRITQLLSEKLYKQGYQTDLRTLSLFALSKKKHAYTCFKKFISYSKIIQNKASKDGILHYISSGHFLGIGKQADGMMVVELVSKQIDMHKCCVYSFINVVITNIFRHLTYKATKKGLIIVIDNLGYNLRLWHDCKLFYAFKVLSCIFDFAAIVYVDTVKRFSSLFGGLLDSVELANVGYMVRRSNSLRSNMFQQAVWSEAVWGLKQLPLLRAKFPNIKFSKHFGGSNDHLLKLFTAKESLLKALLKFSKGDLMTPEYKDDSGSTMKSLHLCVICPSNNVKNYIDKKTKDMCSISRKIERIVSLVPAIELFTIPEFHSVNGNDFSREMFLI